MKENSFLSKIFVIIIAVLGMALLLVMMPGTISGINSAKVQEWLLNNGYVAYANPTGDWTALGNLNTKNIYSQSDSTYNIGTSSNRYAIGYFDNITAPTGRSATYVIAASNSTAHVKAQADYVCDGISDEVEINLAIVAAATIKGKVLLSAGNFSISALTYLHSLSTVPHEVTISGSGWGTILTTTGDFNIWGCNGNDRTIFENMQLVGVDGNANKGITIYSGSTDIVIRNIYAKNLYTGFMGNGAYRLSILDCHTESCVNTGVQLYNCIDSIISRHYSYGDATNTLAGALQVNGTSNVRSKVLGCTIVNSSGQSILVDGGYGHVIDDNTCYNHVVGASIGVENGATFVIVSNNTIEEDPANYKIGIGLGPVTGSTHDITIVGNILKNVSRPIWIEDCSYNTIVGNIISGGGAGAESWNAGIHLYGNSKHNLVSGNTSKNNAYAGIYIQGTSDTKRADYNNVIGNVCYDDQGSKTQDYGVAETGSYSDYNIIEGNDVYDNATAGITKVGSNTKVERNPGYVTENKGLAFNVTLDESGVGIIAHGCATTPTFANVQCQSDNLNVTISSIDATNINILVKDLDGNVVTADTHDFYWEVN